MCHRDSWGTVLVGSLSDSAWTGGRNRHGKPKGLSLIAEYRPKRVRQVAGARYISSFNLLHALVPSDPLFAQPSGQSLLDGGAPFYNSYQCADGGWMSV
jgi:hypothetical protein